MDITIIGTVQVIAKIDLCHQAESKDAIVVRGLITSSVREWGGGERERERECVCVCMCQWYRPFIN
jgi:hypothetical protein